ncbi:hypothetical protein J6590_000975 [Homalodisca vitripennis]|nr:hypothetical protein J6590_000975 [Homalodisca vitripennis]
MLTTSLLLLPVLIRPALSNQNVTTTAPSTSPADFELTLPSPSLLQRLYDVTSAVFQTDSESSISVSQVTLHSFKEICVLCNCRRLHIPFRNLKGYYPESLKDISDLAARPQDKLVFPALKPRIVGNIRKNRR